MFRKLPAITAALGFALLAPAAASAAPTSQSFNVNTHAQQFTVPAGIHRIHVTAWGGSGGAGGYRNGLYGAPGGVGAKIDLDLSVSPGDPLTIHVGGRGGAGNNQFAGDGGVTGGGGRDGGPGGTVNNRTLDGTAGGGGGGATSITDRTGATVLIAGGGGGGGGGGGISVSGYNGGQGGDAGTSASATCGRNGSGVYGNGSGGGAGGACGRAQNGGAGISGSGETPGTGAGTGGGGGGGLVGGSGGASGGTGGGGGGGGAAGTSSWTLAAQNVLVTNAVPGYGAVIVSWDPAPPTGIMHTQRFSGSQRFTVPSGVNEVTVTGWGGAGGSGGGNGTAVIATRGGYGAAIRARVPVTPGDVLAIDAGSAGGDGGYSDGSANPIIGGAGGTASGPGAGGKGGSLNGKPAGSGSFSYVGGAGGGGGAATVVTDTTSSKVLLTAGGGGGGGGDTLGTGTNGGPGGSAGGPLGTGSSSDGDGFYGSGDAGPGAANGAGGRFASAGAAGGAVGDDSSDGIHRGTGGGGGGGVRGGGAGQNCTGFRCSGSAGGGAGGSSMVTTGAQDVTFGNSLAGPGGVEISWIAPVASTTTLAASETALVAGHAVTLTATVAGADAPVPPTGSVSFFEVGATQPLGSASLTTTAPYTATLVTTLPAGNHRIGAVYFGDDAFGRSASTATAIQVLTPLTVHTGALPPVEVGEPYAARLDSDGGVAPYTWSVISGGLPEGLRLNPATGEISGTPASAATASFTVRATDNGSPQQTADQALTIVVNASTLALSGAEPRELEPGTHPITLTGARLRPGLTLTASDDGITFSSLRVEDARTVTGQVTVADGVAPGAYDVTVTEGAAHATCSGCLRVKAPAAVPAATPTPVATPAATPPAPAAPSISPAARAVATLRQAPRVVRRNQVRFAVGCAGATCSGRAVETVKGRTVAVATFTLPAGTTRTVTVKLTRAGRALLARSHRLRVQLTVSGLNVPVRARLTLR